MSADNHNNMRNLLVIKASAGSGKTYTLAKQYIQHLLFTDDGHGRLLPRRGELDTRQLNVHRQLLAITFTNKATDEMKQRIVNELHRLSSPETRSDYLEAFMQRSGLGEQRIRTMARQALDELLFDYSNFNVSTIDSFFQMILRNFARELDRDYNYDIQLDDKYAIKVAIHDFMLSLGRSDKPTQVDLWVKDYQKHLLRGDAEKKKWKFFEDGGDLYTLAQHISSELFRSSMDDVRQYLGKLDRDGQFQNDFSRIRAFKKMIHDHIETVSGRIAEALSQLREAILPFDGQLDGRKSFASWLAKGGDQPLSDSLIDADEQYILAQFKSEVQPAASAIVARLTQLVNGYFRDVNVMDFLSYIDNHLGLLGLLAMIDRHLDDYRRENNSILLSDTNDLIGTVLDSGTDFVYERVGSVIAHFMIDEFQDTSTKQYENFKGLIHESLANGNFNMLIGDAKQSIYRFRNADPTVFREKVDADFGGDITNREDGSVNAHEAPGAPSSTNYRSSRHIVEFNNSFFEDLKAQFDDVDVVAMTYRDVIQGLSPAVDEKKVPGYVKVLTGNYKGLLDDSLIAQAAAAAGQDTGDEVDVPVLAVLPGYLLRLHERYDWGRIGILVNSHSQGDKIVECILNYNQHTTGEAINIISGESLLLINSPVIRRIIAMLRFIDISQLAPGDEDADGDEGPQTGDDDEARMKRNLLRKRLGEQRLYTGLNNFIQALAASDGPDATRAGGILADVFDEIGEGDQQQFVDAISRLLPSSGELTTLVSIVESIIAHFKSDPARAREVDREVAFLLAFQDTVMQFSAQRNGGSVREFLKFWDEKKGSLAVSNSATGDAINIMTIHKAKGLEFDCVVIPYANWQLNYNSLEKNYWMPRQALVGALDAVCPCDGGWNPDWVPPLTFVKKSSAEFLTSHAAFGLEGAAFVKKQQADVLIDNLNKTYVALTRPRCEMHIFCRQDKVSKNEKRNAKPSDKVTLTQAMTRFAQQCMTPVLQDNQPTQWYEQGTPSSRSEIDAKRSLDVATALQRDIDHYAVGEMPLGLRVRVEHASSSHIKAGIRLHSIMGMIHDCNDVHRVVAQGIKHGTITSDPDDPCSLDSVNAHVVKPILDKHSRIAAWFDPANKVYSERTITSAGTSLWDSDGIENLRPDRIVRRPDGSIIVIDYKSGERQDRRYLRQLQGYIAKLRIVFPDASIAGRLWYISHDLILDHHGKPLSLACNQ